MLHYLVKTLVIESCEELGIQSRSFRRFFWCLNLQRPFLLLTRYQSIAEGLPLHLQLLIRQRAPNLCFVTIGLTIAHPGKAERQAITVFRLISKLAIEQFVLLVNRSLFDNRVPDANV